MEKEIEKLSLLYTQQEAPFSDLLIRVLSAHTIERCRLARWERIALFGAGSHTAMLLPIWNSLQGPEVDAIIVSKKCGADTFLSIPIIEAGQPLPTGIQAIVPSSHQFEMEMKITAMSLYPNKPWVFFWIPEGLDETVETSMIGSAAIPCTLSDDCKLDLRKLYLSALNVIDKCRKESVSRVVLFGAGGHTRLLLPIWQRLGGPEIERLIVSKKTCSVFEGIKVIRAGVKLSKEVEAIVPSSLSYEKEMRLIAQRYYPAKKWISFWDTVKAELSFYNRCEILPGTPYSAFAIPVDYPPSLDFRPRWGSSQSQIHILKKWLGSFAKNYREILDYMRSMELSHIKTTAEETSENTEPAWIGSPINAIDLLALYSILRKANSLRYVEIGSGMTTCFAKQAVLDGKLSTKIMSIDPKPRREIDHICDYVVRNGLETLDLSIFDEMESGDVVFMDGSHRSFMNSDVTVFFIDVLPRLKPGVIIHFHDITLPNDYPDSFKYWYWNEQYMLAVYLMNAMERIQPLFPTAFICQNKDFQSDLIKPFYDLGSTEKNQLWRTGCSFWFTHISAKPKDWIWLCAEAGL